MHKKMGILAMAWFLTVISTLPVFGVGGTADEALRLTLPYVTVGTDHYRARFDFVTLPQDPAGIYWKLNWAGLTPMSGPQGGVLDSSWNILNAVVLYQGVPYDIDLAYTLIPEDPSGAYWKLARVRTLPVRIESVNGGGLSCLNIETLDPAGIQQMVQCMQNCGTDPDCMLRCLPSDFGLTFYLAVTFLNESPETAEFRIPPGMVFSPMSGDLQPMMVLHTLPYELPPGQSTFCVPTYCLAADRSAPSESDPYIAGGITGLQCLYDIVELTYGKTLNGLAQSRIQEIIWDCVETGTLSEENRAYLNGLP